MNLIRLLLVLILVKFNFGAQAMGQKLLDPSQFTELAAKELRMNDHVVDLRTVEPLELAVTIRLNNRRHENLLNLRNVYIEYQNEPAQLNEIIHHYVSSMADAVAKPSDHVTTSLLPMVRHVEYIQPYKSNDEISRTTAFDQFAADMVVVYVFDTPNTSDFATDEELKRLGVQRSSLRQLAIANLRSSLRKVDFHPKMAGDAHMSLIGAGGARAGAGNLHSGLSEVSA